MERKEILITSTIEAILTARKAIREGAEIPIEPCVQLGEICSDLDKTGRIVCKHVDGLLLIGNRVECPRQRGRLNLKSDILEEVVSSHSDSFRGSYKERRPYFVR